MNNDKNTIEEKEIYEINEKNRKDSKKVNEIKVSTVLRPEEVITIAKRYHKEMNLVGAVNENIDHLFFNEEYAFKSNQENGRSIVLKAAWKVFVDYLIPNFDPVDYALIVSDSDKKVMGMLNSFYQPMELPKERRKDYVYDPTNFDDDEEDEEEEEEDNENWRKILESFDEDE